MVALNRILSEKEKPALFVGNGINIHGGNDDSSWDDLLQALSLRQGLHLTKEERAEMSNTEFFDILDLARPSEERNSLQSEFCYLMEGWQPADHHRKIVGWASRHQRPMITVNFDENLSRAGGLKFFRGKSGFTDYYPWSSYFSDEAVNSPRDQFGVWHAHGMMRYSRSIRLGLTDYMGSVQRARSWVYNRENSLRASVKNGRDAWIGSNTWVDILFFSPLLIFGFSFGKDENFLRWLFLERAKLQRISDRPSGKTWFVEKKSNNSANRKLFFHRLGVEFITVEDYPEIYENLAWGK
jgi:hypothetical protein